MDTSRYLDLFVQEALEHLEALGKDLLAIERDGEVSVLDSAFRHAHSMKGMAASMGFSPIAELSHALEDLLEMSRDDVTRLDASGIDAALAVSDGISTMVHAAGRKIPLDSAGVDVAGLLAKIRAVASPGSPSRPPPRQDPITLPSPPARTASPGKAEDTQQPPSSLLPRSQVRARVQVSSSSKVPAVRGFLVHKRLGSLGEIVFSDPSLEEMKGGRLPQNRLEIVLATSAGEEAVATELSTVSELETIEVETVAVPAPTSSTGRTHDQATSAPFESIRTVRIRTDLLDGFMDGVGELLLATDRLRQLSTDAELDAGDPLSDAIERVGRIVKSLHRKVMATRMTPLSTVTDRLPRVLRETLRHVDRKADLYVEGAEIELDRAVLDEIESPLGHLVRNCIDHGIETPSARREGGKPEAGRVTLSARRDRDRVLIELSDDGRGLDLDAILKKAMAAGLLNEEGSASLPRGDIAMLACHSGLSTASSITEISGRGVGLDVVKETVESLGGTLQIETEPGAGTLFRLTLPLTIAIQRLLLVGAGEDLYAIPVNKVLHVLEQPLEDRSTNRGHTMVPFLHGLVRAHVLGDLLGSDRIHPPTDPLRYVVVEGPTEKAVALVVDCLRGHFEGVVRPLGRPLELLGGLSGISMLPDGRPVLVLDVASLMRSTEVSSYGSSLAK